MRGPVQDICMYQVGRTLGTPTRQPVELRPATLVVRSSKTCLLSSCHEPGPCPRARRRRAEEDGERRGGQAGAGEAIRRTCRGRQSLGPLVSVTRGARAVGAGSHGAGPRPSSPAHPVLLSPASPTQREALVLLLLFIGARRCASARQLPGAQDTI